MESTFERISKDIIGFQKAGAELNLKWTEEHYIAFHQLEEAGIIDRATPFIEYDEKCGFIGGRQAYVVNPFQNESLDVTVRTKWRDGKEKGQSDNVVFVPAGGRRYVGCTRGDGVGAPHYEYSVQGWTSA